MRNFSIAALLLSALLLSACEPEGPAEEFGEDVDEAVEEVEEGAEELADGICEEVEDATDSEDPDC